MFPCLRPSPTQVCQVTLSLLFGFLWTVLCPSLLPCIARPGTGRPAAGPLGLGPIRGVTLGSGPVTLPFGPSHGQGPLHHLPSGPSHGQGPLHHLSGHSAMTFSESSDAPLVPHTERASHPLGKRLRPPPLAESFPERMASSESPPRLPSFTRKELRTSSLS